jgi:protein-tyrosine phosphatase
VSKRPCGHDSVESDSVYVCFPCKEENEAATRDVVWNAAIEAAVDACTFRVPLLDGESKERIREAIRALRREAK